MSTILAVATEVAIDLGYQAPTTLFGSYDEGDTTDRKLRRALTKTARFLASYWDWPQIRGEHTFTSQANGAQTGAYPADFSRIVKGTMFDRSNNCRVLGPVTSEDWQRRLASSITVGPPIFIERGSSLLLRTHYATGATIAYEYVSTKLGVNASATAISAFGADTDVAAWDDELMHLGMVWSILHRDGATSNEDYAAFKNLLDERVNEKASGDVLDMSGGPVLIDPNWPETFESLI